MESQNKKPNIYIPQWHVESILYFLRGHLIEGDLTAKQMVMAIDHYLADVERAETEEIAVTKEKTI